MTVDPTDETLMAGAAHGADLDATNPAGTVLAGRYEILGLLGIGGMGAVYRAHDRELDEDVALKMLRRGWLEEPGALERFRREVKIARRVTHHNVARTYDIGQAGTDRFLTMELIDGPSLARRLDDQGAQTLTETIRIASAICEALEAAHAAGVVHRDLKPDNVLLTDDRVVVTDFGIAIFGRGDGTSTQGIVGTPAYMAPEQVLGKTADARADLYALGLVMYELLTGERAFVGETPLGIASARLVQPVPDPSSVVKGLPPRISELVRALLARDPADRPASATEVRETLTRVEINSVIPPSPSGRPVAEEVSRTLALLPLTWTGPTEERWVAEGFAEDLEDALCMARGLRVRSGGAPRDGEDARSYGERLGVELALDGSVRRAGDSVLVRLRLTSVQDGFHVWAERFEASLGELLVTSDHAARAVATAAGRATLPEAPRHGMPPEAVELYLRALRIGHLAMFSDERASNLLLKALALAPEDPQILSALAIAQVRESFRPSSPDPTLLEQARTNAERALEVAPHLAEPWVALARVRHSTGDTVGAVRALDRALHNGPSVASAHAFASKILTELDRRQEARQYAERALWLDPEQPFVHLDLLRLDSLEGDWDAVEARLADLHRMHPFYAYLAGPRLSVWADRELLPIGDDVELMPASRLMKELLERVTAGTADHWQSYLDEALATVEPRSLGARMFQQLRAELNGKLGNLDEAMDAVEKSVDAGLEDLAWIEGCHLLDGLRDRPAMARARRTVRERADRALAAWTRTPLVRASA
ncbi:MAG: protein kinase [Sandaracinaceae bacterium]